MRASSDADWLYIAVRDQGPGIPAEDQARLFLPFSKTSVLPTAGERGAGLGLAISRKVVRTHGGKLTCESEPGAGSCFTISLPRRST